MVSRSRVTGQRSHWITAVEELLVRHTRLSHRVLTLACIRCCDVASPCRVIVGLFSQLICVPRLYIIAGALKYSVSINLLLDCLMVLHHLILYILFQLFYWDDSRPIVVEKDDDCNSDQ